MNPHLKISYLYLLIFWLLAPLASLRADGGGLSRSADTVKYQGYRLELYGFEVLKKTDDWIKLRFSAVNSGRMDVHLRKGTEHWVVFKYDRSLFDTKLGGFREHIEYQLTKSNFKLPAGEIRRNIELKIPVLLPPSDRPPATEPVVEAPKRTPEAFDQKGSGEEELPVHPDLREPQTQIQTQPETCPDLRFVSLRIMEQDDKWATVQYTIVNDGTGDYHLFGERNGREDNLVLRAFISGVTTLSRGALPIGGQFFQPTPGVASVLGPGQQLSGRLKLDVRKKTRYLKSLIVQLDGNQFSSECDRTNNTEAVILD